MNRTRLGNPVRGSCSASCASFSSAIFRRVLSVCDPAIRIALPSSFQAANPRQSIYGESPLYAQEIMDRQVAQAAKLILLESVLEETLKDDRVSKTDYYTRSKADAANRLRNDVDVSPFPKTNLIRISLTGRNRVDLADIVNAVTDAAVAESRKSREDRVRKSEIDLAGGQVGDRACGRLVADRDGVGVDCVQIDRGAG